MSKDKAGTTETNDDGLILINRMFAPNAAYLKELNNVGHEVINLYQTDKGDNYIYVSPYGDYAADKVGKIKSILLVRPLSQKNTYEILAKAFALEDMLNMPKNYKHSRNGNAAMKDIHKAQIAEINGNISYGEVPLCNIFKDNIYNGQSDNDTSFYITFKCDIRKPKFPLYISSDESFKPFDDKDHMVVDNKRVYYLDFCASNRKDRKDSKNQILGQKDYAFFSKQDGEAYKRIYNLMQDSDIWEEYNTTLKASELNKSLNINFDTCNFLSAIRKEDDEVIFSNLFAYYFTNFKEFTIKFYDKYGISLNKNYKVSREKNRTDIEIEDERNLIIIENKIKSGIMKYKKSEKDSNNIEFETQLEKNYKVANERELEDKSNRGIKCFIFLPDYSLIKEEDCKFHYSNEEIVYTQVRYSEIYKLFEANRIEDKYYDDFMKALSKHSSVYDNNMFEEMQRRFFKKIQETKEQQ